MTPSRFSVVLKALTQLGVEPLALNAVYRLGLWTGHYQRATAFEPNFESGIPKTVSLFSLPSREQLIQSIGNDGQTRVIAEADEIVAGHIRLFGSELVPLRLGGNWPQAHWTEFEKGRLRLEDDIKFIWEPARFGWAFILGRAYHLTQDTQYAEAFWKYFEQFCQDNPPYLGPQWMSGQEVAIRLMSLVWADHSFAASSASSPERRGQLLHSIYAHALRIPPTLVYARSQNNNHLVTEAAAMYTAGRFFNHGKWRSLGWDWLNWSFQNQISGYGEYVQHSTNYHRLMMQTAMWATAIKNQEWPLATTRALSRAAHWLFSMLDPASGRTPNLGANDGALILPLSTGSYQDFRPTVQAAARAFLRTSLPPGPWDEFSLWLGLPALERVSDSDAYLTEHVRGKNSWAYLRASGFKTRLSHMDQLHLDLWWRGLNIAQDAGTYLYNAEPPWDNPLVLTRVHNTVMVDGRDQMTRAGRFLTLDWFPAYSKSLIESDNNVSGSMRAHHRGYRGVRHERTVTAYQDEHWVIEDRLISQRPHEYRLHWLLPDWEYELEGAGGSERDRFGIRLKSPFGWVEVQIRSDPRTLSSGPRVSLVRAGEVRDGQRDSRLYEGWVSPTYGQKNPALSLAFEVGASGPLILRTEFVFPK